MDILLIANPIAGGDARPRIRRIVSTLEGRGCAVTLVLTKARGDAEVAAAAARDRDDLRIVAAGGDGTLNEVVNGLAPSNTPLAFIPLGTVNVLALELGIPFDPDEAAACALDGVPTPVSVGVAGGRKFLLMAGVGFDAAVVRSVDSRLKRRIGRFAYLVAACARLIRWSPPTLTATLPDGSREAISGAIVGNARYYGGRFTLTPAARLSRDDFQILLLKGGRLPLLRTALRSVAGLRPNAADGRLIDAPSLEIAGEAPVQIDGDDLGDLPMTFSILPRALRLVVPTAGVATKG